MKRSICLCALAVFATASQASFGSSAKGPLRMDIIEKGVVWLGTDASGSGRFSLVGASAAESDSGIVTFTFSTGQLAKTRTGQAYRPFGHTGTLKGKHGTLVIRSTGRQFPVLRRFGFFSNENHVLAGSWSIVRATSRYAGLVGGGGFAGTMLNAAAPDTYNFSYRYEGLVS
jgi:hypothetical protein